MQKINKNLPWKGQLKTMEGETDHRDEVVMIINCSFGICRITDLKIISTVIKFEFASRQCFSHGYINFCFRSYRLGNFRKKGTQEKAPCSLYFVVNWANFPLITNDIVH